MLTIKSWKNVLDKNVPKQIILNSKYHGPKYPFFPVWRDYLCQSRRFLSRIFFRAWFSAQIHHYKSLPPCSVRGVSLVLDNRLMTIIGESEANSFSTSVNIQFLEKELHRYPFFFWQQHLKKDVFWWFKIHHHHLGGHSTRTHR